MSRLETAAAEQIEAAAERFGSRTAEWQKKIEALRSGDLLEADSPDRIAKPIRSSGR